ncbi:MAG: gliding motility-associated C-terminal domain-containing protein [Saprospiraceae bacterium]|nr:gliding motility-associated C-terminal domain-containing protein [Saprospiraceae bacterium]
MRVLVLFFFLLWSWWSGEDAVTEIAVPEICDNGVDDDLDGLIDLNDTVDCFCIGISDTLYTPTSLIPNPSFEDTLCCPNKLAQLDCAADWIQASWATSDYYHTCGFVSDVDRGDPPMPLPSGDAFVGFLDVTEVFGIGSYKEYVGACLTTPMTPGQEYTLEFYLGFGRAGRNYVAKSPFNVVLYGSNSCAELPFGDNLFAQCPSILPTWFEIGEVTLTGSNEWVKGKLVFQAPSMVEAVAIGPGCIRAIKDSYYFLDDLILNESDEFDAVKIDLNGDICDGFITLKTHDINTLDYQWYRNGVALAGQDSPDIRVSRQDTGSYQVRVSDGVNCELSEPFEYYPLIYTRTIDTFICQGGSIMLEGQRIRSEYHNSFSYPSVNYCDSIIEVNVVLVDSSSSNIDTLLCPSQSVQIAGQTYDQAGYHRILLQNTSGCDSIIHLTITNPDTLQRSIDTLICPGTEVMINGDTLSGARRYVQHTLTPEGCDIRWVIDVRHYDTSALHRDTILCSGQPLTSGGSVIQSEGAYPLNYTSTKGCDSTIVYSVQLRDTFSLRIDTQFCAGEEIILEGHKVTTDTILRISKSSVDRCDSIITYEAHRIDFYEGQIDTAICEDEFLVFKGDTLQSAGVYQVQKSSPGACDSIWTVNLVELKKTHFITDTSLCFGEVLVWNGDVIEESGTYFYKHQAQNSCDSIVELRVEVEKERSISVEVLQPITCFDLGDGSVRIAGIKTSDRIVWNDGHIGDLRTDMDTGSYEVTVISQNDCYSSITFDLANPEPLRLAVTPRHLLCQQDRSGSIYIQEMSGGTGELKLFLNSVRAHPINGHIDGLEEGQYDLRLMDDNRCEVHEYVDLLQVEPGTLEIDASATEIVVGDSVTLSVRTEGIGQVMDMDWYGPDGTCFDCSEWTVHPGKGSSQYDVFAMDDKGCEYTASVTVDAKSRFYVPNTFTPNGDDINDYFTLFSDRSVYEITSFRVYDRWGEIIHQSQGVEPGQINGAWDGYFEGQPVRPGVYIYMMEIMDKLGNTYFESGDVTLIR